MAMKRVLSLMMGSLCGLLLAGESVAATLKFSTPTPPPHIMTKAANHFGKLLAEATGNKMKVKVSPLNKLGNVPTVLSLLQSGAVQFAYVPAGDLARREESFYGWFLPYQFKSVTEAGKAAGSPASKEMLKRLEAHGLIGLGYVFPGQRHVLSREDFSSLGDLAGKKVRAFPNEIFETWWKEAGAAPTALPLPEIAPSLVTGVLDAVDVDLDIVVGLKFYKQAPFLGLTNHMSFPGVALASKKWWDGLSDSERDAVKKAFSETESWALVEQAAAEVSNLEKLRNDGVMVLELPAEELRKVGERVTNKFLARDPLIKKFYEQQL